MKFTADQQISALIREYALRTLKFEFIFVIIIFFVYFDGTFVMLANNLPLFADEIRNYYISIDADF